MTKSTNPAEGFDGARKNILLGGWNGSEDATSTRTFQARWLARRCAISYSLAAAIVHLVHGEVAQ